MRNEKINSPENQNTSLQTGLDNLEFNLDLKVHMEGSSYRFSTRQLRELLTRIVWRVIRVKINNANFSLPLLSNSNSCPTIN